MIPSRQEILNCVYGSWRLACFDAAGVQHFDDSPEAALRSFFAAVLVAPAFIAMTLLAPSESRVAQGSLVALLVYALNYCLLWVVFPVIAYRICQVIDRERAFFRFLSANNWTSVIAFHLQLVIAVLVVGNVFPEVLAALLQLAMFAYLVGYQWFIARHCLDVSGPGAIGFVALQFLITLVIEGFVLSILS